MNRNNYGHRAEQPLQKYSSEKTGVFNRGLDAFLSTMAVGFTAMTIFSSVVGYEKTARVYFMGATAPIVYRAVVDLFEERLSRRTR